MMTQPRRIQLCESGRVQLVGTVEIALATGAARIPRPGKGLELDRGEYL